MSKKKKGKKNRIIHHKIIKRKIRVKHGKAAKRKIKHPHKLIRKVKHHKINKRKLKHHHKIIREVKTRKLGIGIKRVYTNIPNFDRLIGGGFEKNTTNLIVGGSGGGKTIFATQFLVEAMKKGERCLYVTFEEKRKQLYSNMVMFGW